MANPDRILDARQQEQAKQVRESLDALAELLRQLPASADDLATLVQAIEQLDDFFLLVVAGEFNSGKSALINALLGERLLAEGVTPTTSRVQILKHSGQVTDEDETSEIAVLSGDADFLWDIHLVDTPGTNAIEREHEAITKHFVPRADFVLFVTCADRPFTESERRFLSDIRDWGKKIVFVINKVDILHDDKERIEVLRFVGNSARELLDIDPRVFPLSARPALEAKLAGDDAAVNDSGLPLLENFLRQTLDDAARFRLKLLSPVGIADRLATASDAVIANRLALLGEDAATVAEIRSSLKGHGGEMRRGFELRLADVDNILHRFEQRGNDYFDETLRIGRVWDLTKKDKIQAEFEKRAIADMPREVEEKVGEIIDWLVGSDLRLWQDVRDRLIARKSEHSERAAGQMQSGFDYDRARLLDTVGKAAERTLADHDESSEARRMAESVQAAVTNTALIEAGAVGLGAAITVAATSTAIDITGIVAAGLLATVGLFVIPYRKQKARKELRERIHRLRTQLMEALSSQFEREVDRSVQGVEEAIAPYVRFVEGEKKLLGERRQQLSEVSARLRGIRKDLGGGEAAANG